MKKVRKANEGEGQKIIIVIKIYKKKKEVQIPSPKALKSTSSWMTESLHKHTEFTHFSNSASTSEGSDGVL